MKLFLVGFAALSLVGAISTALAVLFRSAFNSDVPLPVAACLVVGALGAGIPLVFVCRGLGGLILMELEDRKGRKMK